MKSLGDRMKEYYENRSKTYLTRRTPIIIRLDGKAFHTFTRGMKKPFDQVLIQTMNETAKYLCENIQGCKLAYVQSDEITLLITDYDTLSTDAWFDYNVQKMCSISSSMATLAFNKFFFDSVCLIGHEIKDEKHLKYYETLKSKCFKALFDSRAFNIPIEEVTNCFIWRQQDATRNAIQLVGQAHFPHSILHNKSCNDIQDLLFNVKRINFNDFSVREKRGACIVKEEIDGKLKWKIDLNIPIFSKDRNYIERLLGGIKDE